MRDDEQEAQGVPQMPYGHRMYPWLETLALPAVGDSVLLPPLR